MYSNSMSISRLRSLVSSTFSFFYSFFRFYMLHCNIIFLLLHQDIIRDPDEVYRLVRSPRPEPHLFGKHPPRIPGAKIKGCSVSILIFYTSIDVIQYCTFSWVLLRTPTVILTVPIPIQTYCMMIIFSKVF